VKHNFLVKETNELPRVLREAHHIATTGRPGPVLIDVPKDVSQAPFTGSLDPVLDLPGYRPELALEIDGAAIDEALQHLSHSKRPVILAGQGAMIARAGEELRLLAETLGCPVTTTLLGKGVFPEPPGRPLQPGGRGLATRGRRASEGTTVNGVWPSSGCGRKVMKYTAWPAFMATPTSESNLKPPMPGPWPARGSTTTTGRSAGLTGMLVGGSRCSSA